MSPLPSRSRPVARTRRPRSWRRRRRSRGRSAIPIAFSGQGTDLQDGTLPPSALSWQIIIHHCPSNCHTHLYETFEGVASGSFPAPDHEYPSYLEIQLTATDSDGNMGTTSVNIYPQTSNLTMASAPPGLLLSAGTTTAIAPFTLPFIVGSQVTVVASATQGAYPAIFEFGSWSDGGTASHTFVNPATPSTLTATYATHADLSLAMAGAPPEVCEGETIACTLTVANAGLSQAVNVTVSDTLPDGAMLVSASGSGWTCGSGPVVICTMPTLDVTTAPPLIILLTAPPGTALNSASVGSQTSDANGGNNAASASVTVLPAPAMPVLTAPLSAAVGATGSGERRGPRGLDLRVDADRRHDHRGPGHGRDHVRLRSARHHHAALGHRVRRLPAPRRRPPRRSRSTSSTCPPSTPSTTTSTRSPATASPRAAATAPPTVPTRPNTRAQMAVFLLKSKYGFGPRPAAGDRPGLPRRAGRGPVRPLDRGALRPRRLERLRQRQLLSPRPGHARPDGRLPAEDPRGATYVPPAATGTLFGDVPLGAFAADWIEDLYNRGITGGCQSSPLLYCPDRPNTRGQMAVFLTKTFSFQ